jgi:hypothetical protein
MAKAPSIVDAGFARLRKPFANVVSLIHPMAETRALNCNEAVSHKLPCVEPQIRACDSHTSRKSAPFRAGAKFEPPIRTITARRSLSPRSLTRFPQQLPSRVACHRLDTLNPGAWSRAYHVPVSADPMFRACPVSACLFPGSANDDVFIHWR